MSAFNRSELVNSAKYLVVKVGTNVLTRQDGSLNAERIRNLVEGLCDAHDRGVNVTLVSSGAVGAGMGRLGMTKRPKFLPELQAAAAIGQGALIRQYEEEFDKRGVVTAQALLTATDLSERRRYINVRNTFYSLFHFGAVPIVNENDAVSAAEIALTFGDNDRLAALVANLFPQSLLILLTDVDGLYDGDPALPESKLVPVVEEWTPDLMEMVAEKKSSRSKGGMSSKLKAARIVTNSGGSMIIANGERPNVLRDIFQGDDRCTFFMPQRQLQARLRWFKHLSSPQGFVVVDSGAAEAILNNKSLLPIGVIASVGSFKKGDVVSIVDVNHREIARGLSNYSSKDAEKIARKRSGELAKALDNQRAPYEELIHCDNIFLVDEYQDVGKSKG